jgi:hypothetical protein
VPGVLYGSPKWPETDGSCAGRSPKLQTDGCTRSMMSAGVRTACLQVQCVNAACGDLVCG